MAFTLLPPGVLASDERSREGRSEGGLREDCARPAAYLDGEGLHRSHTTLIISIIIIIICSSTSTKSQVSIILRCYYHQHVSHKVLH